MTTTGRLAALETAYLDARSARDHLDVARARGEPADTRALEAAWEAALMRARGALDATDRSGDPPDGEDARALRAIREGLEAAAGSVLPGVEPPGAAAAAGDGPAAGDVPGAGDGPSGDAYERLRQTLELAYTRAAAALVHEGEPVTRLQVLARLTAEPDPGRRRDLFLALEPLWRSVDGDGSERSPYRGLIRGSSDRWRLGHSPIEANAVAIGVTTADIEAWATATLEGWRQAFVAPARAAGSAPIEPWDWWWLAGAGHRALAAALPLEALQPVNRAVHASLGADLDELGVAFDIHPRAGRPPVAVAFTTFDGRPHRREDGTWAPGRPTILEACTDGGLGELAELVHETGHAIHIAGIRTRPAFADWPDSDALTEALAELVAADVFDPAWQRRWLPAGTAVPAAIAARGRFAEIALDAAWALFEIRLHEAPGRVPNDVWTAITGTFLGIAPHPEHSWWAMRGQLVEAPGYMANYAIGAVLAADLRAAIREARGDWTDGDPGWYPWVRDHVYRFGLERSTRDVLRGVLGRPPNEKALLLEVARGAGG